MFFCGIIAFLLGALMLVAMLLGDFIMGVASAIAGGRLAKGGHLLASIIAWVLLVGGALSTLISSVGYVLKWLGLV